MTLSNKRNYLILSLLVTLMASCSSPRQSDKSAGSYQAEVSREASRPNILFIIVDDMGMADIGSFGSEIETPNLDKLAYAGTRLTNFSVASTCSPTRAMLYTGVPSHSAGLGNMFEELSPNQQGQPGYEGYLNERVVTITELLRDDGYRTYLSGKWHLGGGDNSKPSARGFQKSFSLISGGASHFQDMRPAYAPSPEIKANYFQNGEKLTELPSNFHYSSQFYVDQLIDYLDEDDQSKAPFFGVLAFTAPHWPLQAPDAAIAKYKGRYDFGYDELLARRFKRQQELGVIPANAKPNTENRSTVENGDAWGQLSDSEKRESARSMEVYAAMIDQVDVHVGRLMDYLRGKNLLEDTMIVFMSDNGAEAHDMDETWPKDLFPKIRATIDEGHDFSFDNMGKSDSYVLYGRGWARAGTPAYRLHKAFPTEGGMRVAAFVHYPKMIAGGQIDDRQYEVKDLAPTVLELAGISQPEKYRGKPVKAMSGTSLVPYLRDSRLVMQERVQVFELFGKRMVKQYPWKIVHMPEPYGNDQWQLFNIQQDPTENNDLAKQYPQIVAGLVKHWQQYAKEHGVILPDWVSGY